MANQWFRMYSEFANDPKVQMMSESDQRRLVMLFCLRCNDVAAPTDEEVAFQMRIDHDDWLISKEKFMLKGFIDEQNNVLNWDQRQFITGGHGGEATSKSSNYVYFVADSSQSVVNQDYYVVKIGISKNPWARVKELQTGNEKPIEIVASFRADIVSDREIHEILDAYRTGGEWFKLPSNIASCIINHAKSKDSNYESMRSMVVAQLRSSTTVATKTTTDTDTDTDTDNNKTSKKVDYLADVDKQIAKDYMTVRKNKRAKELTLTSYNSLIKEAQIAGISLEQALTVCIERNWIGFKADWYANLNPRPQNMRDQGRAAAAASVFKPEHTSHLSGMGHKELEVVSE